MFVIVQSRRYIRASLYTFPFPSTTLIGRYPVGITRGDTVQVQQIGPLITTLDTLGFHSTTDSRYGSLGRKGRLGLLGIHVRTGWQRQFGTFFFQHGHVLVREWLGGHFARGTLECPAQMLFQQGVRRFFPREWSSRLDGTVQELVGLFALEDARDDALTDKASAEIVNQDCGECVEVR